MWGVECEVWGVGCGMWGVGCVWLLYVNAKALVDVAHQVRASLPSTPFFHVPFNLPSW